MLAGVIAIEAVAAARSPPDVEGASSSSSACPGALVNVGAAWSLSRAERRSLNVEGARAHVLADLYGSVAAVAAGLAVLLRGSRRRTGSPPSWSPR